MDRLGGKSGHMRGEQGALGGLRRGRLGKETGHGEGAYSILTEQSAFTVHDRISEGPQGQEQKKQASQSLVGNLWGRSAWCLGWVGLGRRMVCPLHWALSQAFPAKTTFRHPHPSHWASWGPPATAHRP